MSLTIENKVLNLLTDMLEDYLIAGAQGFVKADASNAKTLSSKITLTGTYAQSYPRKFDVDVTAIGTAHVKETTISYTGATIVLYEDDVSFTNNVAFAIADTGINLKISGAAVSDFWIIRMGNAFFSMTEIELGRSDGANDMNPGSIQVVFDNDREDIIDGNNRVEITAAVYLFLCVSAEQYENGHIYEIKGDIRDAIAKCFRLNDGTACIATDFKVIGTQLMQLNEQKATFVFDTELKYRVQRTNSRSR